MGSYRNFKLAAAVTAWQYRAPFTFAIVCIFRALHPFPTSQSMLLLFLCSASDALLTGTVKFALHLQQRSSLIAATVHLFCSSFASTHSVVYEHSLVCFSFPSTLSVDFNHRLLRLLPSRQRIALFTNIVQLVCSSFAF